MTETTTEPQPQPEPEPQRPRRLRRSSKDRMLAGVAGGIGEYFGIDPVLVRIGFVALALLGGAGLIVYPVAWVLVPDADGRARGLRELARLGALVTGAVVTTVGLFAAAAAAAGLGGATAVAIVILVAGVAIFVAAFGGGKLRLLIVPAFAVALGATGIAAADVDLHGGFKDTTLPYTRADHLKRSYEVGAGRLELDLRSVRFPAGDTRIDARVGIGELVVLVPRGVCVATESTVGAGSIDWFGHESGGTDLDLFTQASQARTPRLVVRGHVGMGRLQIDDAGTPAGPEAGGACADARNRVRPH
jgi:phage shock protein PspC (stress-responsive transcriptional regulator)/predicted membrane protein